jgi:hypothetical protein
VGENFGRALRSRPKTDRKGERGFSGTWVVYCARLDFVKIKEVQNAPIFE